MNNCVFAGRVGKDCELKYTQSGKAVASFSLAINNGKDQNGEKRQPLWLKCTLWEKKAETLSQYIHKGDMVIVSGSVNIEKWQNQQNETQAQIVVNVFNFTFGGSKGDGQQAQTPAQQPAPQPISDEDSPF